MLSPLAWTLLLSPMRLVELTVDRTVLPNRACDWDRIGLFKLRDGKQDRLVLLYCYDTDSVSEREFAKHGSARLLYPNSFAVHAVYKDASGKWVHQRVLGYGRVRFVRVEKAEPEQLVLKCRPNFQVQVRPDEDVAEAMKRADRLNKPFTKRIAFAGGVLTGE